LWHLDGVTDEFDAWVQIAPQPPLAAGPLDGLTFGVKDIIEVKGCAFECGSPLYAGRVAARDAPVVRTLRECGAIFYGKTQTAAFAYFDPPPTRNPRNPAHTPGGSSSGSAAAVAAGTVDFALGTQTQGSVIRPAAFCGVCGFKPAYGIVPTQGVMPFAPSLDTVGWFARDLAIIRRVWECLNPGAPLRHGATARFGVLRGLPDVELPMHRAFEKAAACLNARDIDLPVPYMELLCAVRLVNDYEGSRTHQERWREHGRAIGEKLSQLVERGLSIPEQRYNHARELLESTRLESLFHEVDLLITPAAPGPAPLGLGSTGDPVMNAVWTGLGLPALSIPMPVAADELPLGLQIIGAREAGDFLLTQAEAIILS
jgi:Asp-tRNA(Asn)/Glu-tRNA(Gln) amidotransferase A subunit family amidase